MGRVKLKLKTVESETGRIVTYSKRKNALLKKTNELAVLCEIDVVLLMFSPTGRVALQMGNAVFDQIIRRFANTSAEERARSNMKVFETLKKSYKNSDHEVRAKYFSVTRSRSVEDLNAQSNILQNQLAKTQQRLSDWRNTDKIENVELLGQMEDYLKGLCDNINAQKRNFSKKEAVTSAGAELLYPGDGCQPALMPNYLLESSFNTGSHLRFRGNNFQNIASMSNPNYFSKSSFNVGSELRFLGNDNQNMPSMSNPKFILPREPQMGTTLSAAYLSTYENLVTDNNREYANNLLQRDLLRNELVALRQEARRSDFARSDFLINAYNGGDYIATDVTKEGPSGNRFCEMEYLRNNELFVANNNGASLQQQKQWSQQSIHQQQQNIVPLQQQNTCQQQNTDYSFEEVSLGAPSSSYDPILEWSDSFGALEFMFPDSQQPLSVDDYAAEMFDELNEQPKLPN